MTRHFSIALLLTMLACGPELPADEGATESTATEGDGDGDGDGDDVPLECAPPNDVFADFTVTPTGIASGVICMLIGDNAEDTFYEMTYDCDGETVTIQIESTIAVKPTPAQMVRILYRDQALVFGEERWLAVRDIDGNLVLGGISGWHLHPHNFPLEEFFGFPILIESTEQPCDVVPHETGCGLVRRLALDVVTEFGVGDPVFDHGSWYADYLGYGYAIEVEEAWGFEEGASCTDIPSGWFQLLVVRFPSD